MSGLVKRDKYKLNMGEEEERKNTPLIHLEYQEKEEGNCDVDLFT